MMVRLLLALWIAGASAMGAESLTLTTTPTFTNTVTPTINGNYADFNGLNIQSIVVEVISVGVTVATATDNGPNNGPAGAFSVAPTGGMALGTTYDLRVTAYNADAGGGAAIGQALFPGGLVLDGTAPTLSAMSILDDSPASSGPLTFHVQFSETVLGVAAADFAIVGTGGASGTITGVSGSGATYVVTVNSLTNDGTVGIGLAGGATITDRAGNALTTPATPSPNQAYVIDTTAPRLASIIRLNANPTGLGTVDFAVTFSEPVTGVTAARFNAAGVTTGAISVTGSGQSYTVSVPITAGTGTLTLTINNTGNVLRDVAGNILSNVTATGTVQTYTVENSAPTVTSITLVGTSPSSATSAQFLVTFSASVTGGAAANFVPVTTGGTVAHGSINVAGSGSSRTVTVNTITGDGPLGLSVLATPAIEDTLGNDLVNGTPTGANQSYTIDRTAPRLATVTRLGSDPTGAGTVDFAIAFSEPVINVVAARFTADTTGSVTVNAGGIALTGSGQAYTVSVPITGGTGTVGLNFNDGSIQDLAGNDLNNTTATGTTQTYTVQNTAPSVTSITLVDATPSHDATVDFLVTFSTNVTGGALANFSPAVTGTVLVGTVSVSGSGATRTVSVPVSSGDGTLGLTVVTTPVIEDSLGNDVVSGVPTGQNQTYTIDRTAPQLTSIVRLGANPTNAGSVDFSVTYSEAVTGVVAARFSAAAAGVTTGVITVAGSGQAYVVTVPVTGGEGTLGLTTTTTGISDAAGNTLSSGVPTGTNQVYDIDTTAPRVADIVRFDGSPTGASSVRFLVTFSESVTGVDPNDFALVLSAGVSATTPVSLTGSGSSYTITVAGIFSASTGSLGLALTAGGLSDVAGNALANVTPTGSNETYAITQSAPTLNYPYASQTWLMFEDHPSAVNAPAWNDPVVPLALRDNVFSLANVPYVLWTTNLIPWVPPAGYASYTTLVTAPDFAATPPRVVRSAPQFFDTTLDNLGSPTFTGPGQTGTITVNLTVPALTGAAPGTVADSDLDRLEFHSDWTPYWDATLTFDHTARTIAQAGNPIASWAYTNGQRTMTVTIGENVSTTTVGHLISMIEGRIGGRNPTAADRRMTLSVTNAQNRTSNTVTANLRPVLYDDNARVAVGEPAINETPDPIVVLPGITRTGSVAVNDVDSAFSFAITTPPSQGTLTVDAATGFFSYSANLGSTGSDMFAITVTDLGPSGALIWYGQPRIPTTVVAYDVVIADAFDPLAPAIRSNPPFEIAAADTLVYPLTFTAGVANPISALTLIGVDPTSFAPAQQPSVTWNGTTWVLSWPQVPVSATGYYDFGLLLTVEDADQPPPRPLRATFQPVLLKVRNVSGGG